MRARKRKNREPRLSNVSEYIISPEELSQGVNILGTETSCSEIHLEIGAGKGGFVFQLAMRHPEVHFLVVERSADCVLLGIEAAKRLGITNVKYMTEDIENVTKCLPDSCINAIYLNFSDPWPKNKHFTRRLTYRGFLEEYKRILKTGGIITQKTDCVPLFDFSLKEYATCGFEVLHITRDLKNADIENNIMTEYETRFTDMGIPINRVCVKKP